VSEPGRSSIDDIIELYKRDVDRTLIRQRLTRSVEERLEDLMELQRFAEELRRAGRVTFEADD
jgi:predicted RecB family endonuclease